MTYSDFLSGVLLVNKNEKTGEVRIASRLKGNTFVVVKLFRTDDEYYSMKIWRGDFEKTASYWSTNIPVPEGELRDQYVKQAFEIVLAMKEDLGDTICKAVR